MPSDFSNWHNGNYSNVNSFQRSYKQKPPPGKTRNVERETGHVLRFLLDFDSRMSCSKQFHQSFFILSNLGTLTSFHLDCYVHSNPGDFLFLDKFTSTGFINKIYNMEVGIFLRKPDSRCPKKEGTSWLFRCAKTTSGWWLLQSVERLGCRWYPSLF